MSHYNVIRDPVYGPITLDPVARELVDTREFQRLRRIRQLSMASLVYPSAMHTRFEHAVGVYHLSGRILSQMQDRGELSDIPPEDTRLVRYACLLHDLGHFSGAHLLEEINYPGACHESAGADWFSRGEVGRILRQTGIPKAGERISAMVAHRSDHPLAGIVAGDLDADKIDWIRRDAYHCGLPEIFDQGHLVHMLRLVDNPDTGRPEVGLDISGLSSFEAMLYAKFSLFRSVYFHPTTRSATAMMRALLASALDSKVLEMEELHRWTDDEVFTLLQNRVAKKRNEHAKQVRSLSERLVARDLYVPSAHLPLAKSPEATVEHGRLVQCERQLEAALDLGRGEAIVDVPRKPTMLSTNVLVRRKSGQVVSASELGPDDQFALQPVRDLFYKSSGRLHLFTGRATEVPEGLFETVLAARQPWQAGPVGPTSSAPDARVAEAARAGRADPPVVPASLPDVGGGGARARVSALGFVRASSAKPGPGRPR